MDAELNEKLDLMNKALSTKNAGEIKLEAIEKKINSEAFEAFYHIGQQLLQIKKLRMYEDAGFKSWGAYCASGRISVEGDKIGLKAADDYIRSSELRPKIGIIDSSLSKRVLLELCKCETDKDAQRVAKKSIALAKKTDQRVTAKLIASIRDGDGETGRASKKRDARLSSASLNSHLKKLAGILFDWRYSLERVDLEQWEEVDPVILTQVRNKSNALYKLPRS